MAEKAATGTSCSGTLRSSRGKTIRVACRWIRERCSEELKSAKPFRSIERIAMSRVDLLARRPGWQIHTSSDWCPSSRLRSEFATASRLWTCPDATV